MSTTALEAAPEEVEAERIAGVAATSPTIIWALPDHTAHVSFHLATPAGPGYNVHADGAPAELARLTIHKGDELTIVPRRIYRHSEHQMTPDVDAESFELTVR